MKNNIVKKITINSAIAAIYVIVSMLIAPISFGMMQFRVSEILTLLPFINPSFGIGITLGCLITNQFSPFGMLDIIFGTLSTGLTVFFVGRSKSLLIASFYPTIFSSIVALIITTYTNTPFLINALYVMSSEFIITFIIGQLVITSLIKNQNLYNFIKDI